MRFVTLAAAFATLILPTIAQAGIVLSRAVVDIQPNADAAQDIEIWNDGSEVSYVVVEPAEIVAPGSRGENRVPVVDPGVGGLLVSPQRMILQPGERKTVRVAVIAPRQERDRIYRMTIKPVAGPVTAPATALKLLVGYDVLIIYRPAVPAPKLVGERQGGTLVLRNVGNTNVELYDGQICPTEGAACQALPSRRLYAGQVWSQSVPVTGKVAYRSSAGVTSQTQSF